MESITKIMVLEDGQKVAFPRLELEDCFGLCDELLAEREQTARKLAKEENLDRYELMNLILDLRNRRPTIQEMLVNCGVPQGASMVLRKSMSKAKFDADKQKSVLAQLAIPDCIDLARMLVLDVQEKQEKPVEKKAGEESPLSVSPVTSPVSKTTRSGKSKHQTVAFYGQKEDEPATTEAK